MFKTRKQRTMSLDQKTKDYVFRPENKGLCPGEKPNIVLDL